jgi:hypothetical protein
LEVRSELLNEPTITNLENIDYVTEIRYVPEKKLFILYYAERTVGG